MDKHYRTLAVAKSAYAILTFIMMGCLALIFAWVFVHQTTFGSRLGSGVGLVFVLLFLYRAWRSIRRAFRHVKESTPNPDTPSDAAP